MPLRNSVVKNRKKGGEIIHTGDTPTSGVQGGGAFYFFILDSNPIIPYKNPKFICSES
jgi:hypothetical protein